MGAKPNHGKDDGQRKNVTANGYAFRSRRSQGKTWTIGGPYSVGEGGKVWARVRGHDEGGGNMVPEDKYQEGITRNEYKESNEARGGGGCFTS